MIHPVPADIWRSVTHHEGGAGFVESFDDDAVFVVYNGDLLAKASRREDLEWAIPDFVDVLP